MSMLPFIMGHNPHRLLDQDFALALTPEDLLHAIQPMMPKEYYRPWRPSLVQRNLIGSTIKSDKDKFQVNLDVQHFTPEEVTVKTADGYVVIEGKHEEKQDEHGFVSRQFSRRYKLPKNCDPATVQSTLSSDGVLIVVAPKVAPSSKDERTVPIAQTGPVRKVIKETVTQPETQTDANGPEKN